MTNTPPAVRAEMIAPMRPSHINEVLLLQIQSLQLLVVQLSLRVPEEIGDILQDGSRGAPGLLEVRRSQLVFGPLLLLIVLSRVVLP